MPDPRSGGHHLIRERGNEPGTAVFEIASPWVLIDAGLTAEAFVAAGSDSIEAALSTDAGRSWATLATLTGPFQGSWAPKFPVVQRSDHGALTPVAGKYGFLVRMRLLGPGAADSVGAAKVEIVARFQHNPRTLPALSPGDNDLQYRTGASASAVGAPDPPRPTRPTCAAARGREMRLGRRAGHTLAGGRAHG